MSLVLFTNRSTIADFHESFFLPTFFPVLKLLDKKHCSPADKFPPGTAVSFFLPTTVAIISLTTMNNRSSSGDRTCDLAIDQQLSRPLRHSLEQRSGSKQHFSRTNMIIRCFEIHLSRCLFLASFILG